MAVMVELVADPNIENEEAREVQKGDPASLAPSEAAPQQNDVVEPDETPKAETVIETEELPENVPIPVRKPKPERRKAEEKAPDKTRHDQARGLKDDPKPDIPLNETLKLANQTDTSLSYEAARGITRNVQAERRWFGLLAAHLERRKRYPHSAQSRRQEGTVHVRFTVAPDGTIVMPELVRPSGIDELDEEVLDLMRRASPVPKPPEDINPYVTVPIEFRMKR